MPANQKDVKNRISSVKNIHKITRAMEMVAAARLRRAEQRIEALRPYAVALRRLTTRAASAAEHVPRIPVLEDREDVRGARILCITGDRGLAGSFNQQIVRAGMELRSDYRTDDGVEATFSVVGRRGESALNFRDAPIEAAYTGFTDRPSFANAREIAADLVSAFLDEDVDRVELIYNRYESPLTQYVRRHTLLPLARTAVFGEDLPADFEQEGAEDESVKAQARAAWDFEPEAEVLLAQLATEYVELSVYRALLESTASEHGARMTAMRNAAKNANEMIDDLTLEANRARQAEITQEILEVVSGAEALS